jgi:hypothetical protein
LDYLLVKNDANHLLQDKKIDICPETKVLVAEWLDGSIHILHQRKEVPYEEISHQVLQKIRIRRQSAEYISMNT